MAADKVDRAVLLDLPLRLWAQSQQHSDEVLREFALMLEGERSGQTELHVPRALLELADMFTQQFGPLLDQVTAAREEALLAGRDRMDSVVLMPPGTPALVERVRRVLDDVDEFCRSGDLLTLERSELSRRLFDWTCEQVIRQYEGGQPTPWPGPF